MKLVFSNYQGAAQLAVATSAYSVHVIEMNSTALRRAHNAVAQQAPIQLLSKRTLTFWTYYEALYIQ